MRIAIFSWETMHSIHIGGVAVHVSELSDALKSRGHEVHVFTRPAYGESSIRFINGVCYHYCRFDLHPDFITEINNMCRSFVHHFFETEDQTGCFDVVHAHDWLSSNAAVWIKEGRGKKMVLTIHSTEYGRCGNNFYDGQSNRICDHERNGINRADHVITVSEALKREICWIYEVPYSKVTTIHNGIYPYSYDRLFTPNEIREHINVGKEDPMILYAGRITDQKGPDILVNCIPLVLQQIPSAKFVFAGDGDLRTICENSAKYSRVDHATRFLGYHTGHFLKYLIKSCDLVVVPSRNEPFGIVILEAWNAGKPVVVTKIGGPVEFVDHEIDGLHSEINPVSLSSNIINIINDAENARLMGKNGKRKLKNFHWDVIAKQTENVYYSFRDYE